RGGADAVGAILTADQLMTPEEAFRRVLGDALAVAARSDAIVTLGVEPDHPATGFGYIARAEKVDFGTASEFAKVERFVEKPDLETARAYLATGRYSWNAGMFIWKASTMAAAFAAHAPEFSGLIDAVAAAPDVEAVMAARYPAIRATSVDYAVMEKATNILVARCAFTWDDVGGWNAIAAHFPADARGNVRLGKTAVYDAGNNIIVSDDAHVTAVVGLENVVVVHTPHATLVCARDRAQDVKQLVRSLGE
ncbi:MAG: mannose-1-phosphate guanylyltransferase, partial [Kiritimatiellae bacterium]|nr:mannose-1-phosphate guanylyltransferase [Kiritimatiellia bacterium]